MTGSGLYIRKHPFLPAPAAVALWFGLLCLSALSSCTGCSYNHEMRRNFKIITPDLHILHKISSIVPAR